MSKLSLFALKQVLQQTQNHLLALVVIVLKPQ